jgi:hypothetical protein
MRGREEKLEMEGERDAFPGNLALARPLEVGGRGEQLGENAPPIVGWPARLGRRFSSNPPPRATPEAVSRVDVGLIFGADEKRLCLFRQRHWTLSAQQRSRDGRIVLQRFAGATSWQGTLSR